VWTTKRTKQAIISPRPVRVAYIVPVATSHDLLDMLFDEAMSRWGGRRTPIIQCDGADLSADDWRLLSLWDPDIIYAYINLDAKLHRRLAHRLAPSEIAIHEGDRLRPQLAAVSDLLNSVSVVPILAKLRSYHGQTIVEVLDKERHVRAPRDLADSFGFASNSLNDFSLLPNARRISLRPPDNDRYAQRFSMADEITYVERVDELETKIAQQRNLLCLAQMSDMMAPYLRAFHEARNSWEDHLSIVIGNEVSDRLLFWNGVHRYQSLMDDPGHTQLLRLSLDRFTEGVPAWVLRLTSGVRNRRHINGNAAPRTIVKSCSVGEETLNRVAAAIRAPGMSMSSAETHRHDAVFAPLLDHRAANERGQRAAIFISGWQTPAPKADSRVRFERDQFELPLVSPFHLRDMGLGPTTRGTWATDLRIERDEDHSPYEDQRHRWMFPRRLRLEQAVRLENYGPGRMTLPPLLRPTEEGDLSLRDGLDWKRPIITLPSDLTCFTQAVSSHHPVVPEEDQPREDIRAYRFIPVEVSDKGRDLLGVLQLFRSLPEALMFLTNPYWLSVIERLCPTEPDANQRRVDELAGELRQAVAGQADGLDFERLAKRVMNRTAAWMRADNKRDASVSYETLVASLPNELRGNEARNALEGSVKYLRDRSFLRQGFAWTCRVCQYRNWAHLEDMVPVLHCEICRVKKSAPVAGNSNVHFRLNPFVAAAFSSASSQGSVAWALTRLANRASWSFMFTPALDISKASDQGRFSDLDVLASIDGEVFLLEVKRGFAGVNTSEVEKLVEVATILRPDFAGFAVQRPRAECTLDAAAQEEIARRLAAVDVRFELWTADDQDPWGTPMDIPLAYGRTMDWSAW
jgi:hypothetical protein